MRTREVDFADLDALWSRARAVRPPYDDQLPDPEP